MKDPLGENVLQRALAEVDRLNGEVKKLAFAGRQTATQNADLVRMLAAVVRRLLATVERVDGPGTGEEVLLTFEQMAEEGTNPKLVYRINRKARTLVLRLTPFPANDAEAPATRPDAVDPNAPPAPPLPPADPRDLEPEKAPRSRIILAPGENNA